MTIRGATTLGAVVLALLGLTGAASAQQGRSGPPGGMNARGMSQSMGGGGCPTGGQSRGMSRTMQGGSGAMLYAQQQQYMRQLQGQQYMQQLQAQQWQAQLAAQQQAQLAAQQWQWQQAQLQAAPAVQPAIVQLGAGR